jgi:hypothetical protein
MPNNISMIIGAVLTTSLMAGCGVEEPESLAQAETGEQLATNESALGGLAPLKLFYSLQREDNDSTATAAGEQEALAFGYYLVRVEGYIFENCDRPDTVPLNLFYSPLREDNFTTATAAGTQDALDAGYSFVRTEGCVFPTWHPGTVPLKLFFSNERQDNITTATADGEHDALTAGYWFVRVEGYVFP